MKIQTEKLIEQYQRINNKVYSDHQEQSSDLNDQVQTSKTQLCLEAFYLDAATRGDIDRVRHFITRGVNRNATDELGRNGMILAAMRGHANVIDYLAKSGVNKAHKDLNGYTALMHASFSKHKTARDLIIKLLVGEDTF